MTKAEQLKLRQEAAKPKPGDELMIVAQKQREAANINEIHAIDLWSQQEHRQCSPSPSASSPE